MAGQTQSAASRRRAERAARERRQRLIVLGALGGLVAVAGIIFAGLYLTQYRAPRAHILTVGGRDYDAAAVARRGSYHLLFEGGAAGASSIAQITTDLLVDEAVARLRAPSTVGDVSDEAIERELMERLSFVSRDGDDDDGDGYVATTIDGKGFAEALEDTIRISGLSRDEYRDLVVVQLLVVRLRERFRDEVGDTTPQVHLSRIRLADTASAEEVRRLALDGGDFAELVREHTIDTERPDDDGDLGWLMLGQLIDEVAEAVTPLQAGDIAPVVASGLFFDVYLVAEREEERPLDETQAGQLVNGRLEAWLDAERDAVEVKRDLSRGEEEWITDRVSASVRRALETRR